jgi:predicted RND superfamily exporter protein
MLRIRKYISCLLLGLALTALPSCKAKYLELDAQYQKARQKKTDMEKEIRTMKNDNKVLADSLAVLKAEYAIQESFSKQILETEVLKKNFLEKKVPYYQAMQKRQQKKNK